MWMGTNDWQTTATEEEIMSHYLRIQSIEDAIQRVLQTAGEAEKIDLTVCCIDMVSAVATRTFMLARQRVYEKVEEGRPV